jgi:hypothetical protein
VPEQRKSERLAALAIGLGDATRERADPQNESLALRDGDGMPGIEEIERV